jgi:hypothetical protein
MNNEDRWEVVQRAHQAAGGAADELIPALVEVIDTESWREFVHPMRGLQRYSTFGSFCAEQLGLAAQAVEVILDKSLFKADAAKVRKMIREDIAPVARHGEIGNGRVDNDESRVATGKSTQGSNQASYVIARLKRDDPDLAQEVVEGRMSAHAAAVKAGIKKPTATIPVDTPENAVRALLRRFTAVDIAVALGPHLEEEVQQ